MFNNAGINKVFLVGHIGKTPRLHSGTDNQNFHCFPMVTTEYIKKENQNVEHAEWHQIKIPALNNFSSAESLEKGQLIYIEGKVKTRAFTDELGIKRYRAEIYVSNFNVLNSMPVELAAMPL
jgi:single-strand DNA-binding protein